MVSTREQSHFLEHDVSSFRFDENKTQKGAFKIDVEQLIATKRVVFGDWTQSMMQELSKSIGSLAELVGTSPIQRGRVIAVRQTDRDRLFSAFKAAFYHSNYDDMQNTERFLSKIVPSHHSYEPIRGETILFLFIGVSKTVYDGLSMFCSGRPSRIIGGSRHSVPWGIEMPINVDDQKHFIARNMELVEQVVMLDKKKNSTPQKVSEYETARAQLPNCYLMAPFLLEFSEEALITKVFKQRLWEKDVALRDTGYVVQNMWDCCCALDEQKFSTLYDYHGPHTVLWEDGMRCLRDANMDAASFLKIYDEEKKHYEKVSSKKPTAYEVMESSLERIRLLF